MAADAGPIVAEVDAVQPDQPAVAADGDRIIVPTRISGNASGWVVRRLL